MTWPPHTGQSYGHGMGCNMPPIFDDLWQACFALMYKWGHDLGAPLQISNPFFCNLLLWICIFSQFLVCSVSFSREWMARMDGEKSCTRKTIEWYILLQIPEMLQFLQLLFFLSEGRSWEVLHSLSRRGENPSSFLKRGRENSNFEALEISFTNFGRRNKKHSFSSEYCFLC